jgi:hypothetical protein
MQAWWQRYRSWIYRLRQDLAAIAPDRLLKINLSGTRLRPGG